MSSERLGEPTYLYMFVSAFAVFSQKRINLDKASSTLKKPLSSADNLLK